MAEKRVFNTPGEYAGFIEEEFNKKGIEVTCVALYGCGCWVSCLPEYVEEVKKFVREEVYNFEKADNEAHRNRPKLRTIHFY